MTRISLLGQFLRNVSRRLEIGEKEELKLSTAQLLQSTVRLFTDKRMLLLVSLMVFSGLSYVNEPHTCQCVICVTDKNISLEHSLSMLRVNLVRNGFLVV